MNEDAFEAGLREIQPASPPPDLETEIGAILSGVDFPVISCEPGSQSDEALERVLRETAPMNTTVGLEESLSVELSEDLVLENILRTATPAAMSEKLGRAVAAQMELRIVGASTGVPDDISQIESEEKGIQSGRPYFSVGLWGSVAAALVGGLVWLALPVLENPVTMDQRANTAVKSPGVPNAYAGVEPKNPYPPVSQSQISSAGDSGGRRTRVTASSQTGQSGAFSPGTISGPRAAGPGNVSELDALTARQGSGVPGASEDFLPEPLNSRKLAIASGGGASMESASGAISSRTLVASGTSRAAESGRSATISQGGTDLLDTLAAGRVEEVVPVDVLGLIQGSGAPAATASVNPAKVKNVSPASGYDVAKNTVVNRPEMSAVVDNRAGVAGAGIPETAADRISVAEASGGVGALAVSGLTTASEVGVPRLAEDTAPSVTGGRVTDSSLGSRVGNVGLDGTRAASSIAEQVLYENTDGAVTFSLVRTGDLTIGRFVDGSGAMLTEGLVQTPGDVARIAQRAQLIKDLSGSGPALKGE